MDLTRRGSTITAHRDLTRSWAVGSSYNHRYHITRQQPVAHHAPLRICPIYHCGQITVLCYGGIHSAPRRECEHWQDVSPTACTHSCACAWVILRTKRKVSVTVCKGPFAFSLWISVVEETPSLARAGDTQLSLRRSAEAVLETASWRYLLATL